MLYLFLIIMNLKGFLDNSCKISVFPVDNVHLSAGKITVWTKLWEIKEKNNFLINGKTNGCAGGDLNCILNKNDATKNQENKISPSLKKLEKTFSWEDSYRILHLNSKSFSRYEYERRDLGHHAGPGALVWRLWPGVAVWPVPAVV